MTNTADTTNGAAPPVHPEAAAWVARLQDPAREADTARALHAWLDEAPGHPAALGEARALWNAVGDAGRMYQRTRRRRQATACAAAFAVVLCAITLGVWRQDAPVTTLYQTGIGEQRFTILEDGSQVTLNTNSQLSVHFTGRTREITLLEGEAMFDIAHDAAKPFIVHVDSREVRALGTSFVVYKTADSFAVTLFEGKVSVGPHLEQGEAPTGHPDTVVLTPGQQWNLKQDSVQQLTPLQLESASQWRRQELLFNDTPLPAAIAEMNRYIDTPLVIDDPAFAGRTVSGVFRIGDTESFVSTLKALYGVDITRERSPAAQP